MSADPLRETCGREVCVLALCPTAPKLGTTRRPINTNKYKVGYSLTPELAGKDKIPQRHDGSHAQDVPGKQAILHDKEWILYNSIYI